MTLFIQSETPWGFRQLTFIVGLSHFVTLLSRSGPIRCGMDVAPLVAIGKDSWDWDVLDSSPLAL